MEQLDQIQNMTLGGVLPDGSGNYTRLTELMLKAVSNMGYKGPNLALRVHPSMPQHFWPLITSCLATGKGLPALYNDEEAIPALQRGGYRWNWREITAWEAAVRSCLVAAANSSMISG